MKYQTKTPEQKREEVSHAMDEIARQVPLVFQSDHFRKYLDFASTFHEMTYEFKGLLNGNHPTKKNETETGAEEDNSFDVPLHIFFPSYTALPGWETATRNAYYRVTVNIYGKQHKNSTDADWKLVDTI